MPHLLLSVGLASFSFAPSALAQYDAGRDDAVIAVTIEPRALYLTSLRASRSRHGGPELALGVRVPFAPSWAVVLRARGAFGFDIVSPEGESDGTTCGGYYFYSCSPDTDMRFPIGGEVGVRLDDLSPLGRGVTFAIGLELLISGTGYLDSYEDATRTFGSLGAAASLTLELLVGERWGVGLAAGGRLEAELDGSTGWAGGHGGVRISRRF